MNTPTKIYELPNFLLRQPIFLESSVVPTSEGHYGSDLYRVSSTATLGILPQGESFDSRNDAVQEMARIIEQEYQFLLGCKEKSRLVGSARTIFERISSYIARPKKQTL